MVFMLAGCSPVQWPEPFSVWDACASTMEDDPMGRLDTNGDGLLTREDVASGTAVMVAEIHHPDGVVMTTAQVDTDPYYMDNDNVLDTQYSPRMQWACTPRPGVFPWHTVPDPIGDEPPRPV